MSQVHNINSFIIGGVCLRAHQLKSIQVMFNNDQEELLTKQGMDQTLLQIIMNHWPSTVQQLGKPLGIKLFFTARPKNIAAVTQKLWYQ